MIFKSSHFSNLLNIFYCPELCIILDQVQKYVFKQQSSARTALGPSRPQRLICSRWRSYIPATVHFMKYPFRHKLMDSQYSYLQILTVRLGSNPADAYHETDDT